MLLIKRLLIVLISLSLWSTSVYSGFDENVSYDGLFKVARDKGFVGVFISFKREKGISAWDLLTGGSKVQQWSEKKEQAIFDELGSEVSLSTVWRPYYGAMAVYVTEEGLVRLINSQHTRLPVSYSYTVGEDTFYDSSGTLVPAIEAEIDKNGWADVEVVLNVENLRYQYLSNGETLFLESAELDQELAVRIPQFTDSLQPNHIQYLAGKGSPVQRLKIDLEGWFALRVHKDIRAIRLVNAKKKVFKLDEKVLEHARENGFAQVILGLFNPFGYSPMSGRIPAKAWESQEIVIKETLNDFFAAFEKGSVKRIQDFGITFSSYVELSYSALQQLSKTPDLRIERIRFPGGGIGLLSTPNVQPVARYDDTTGLLMIDDVKVDGESHYVSLQDQGDFQFLLINATPLVSSVHSVPASYSTETLIADIPTVSAFGKIYKVKMKNTGDYLFSLTEVKE